MTDPQRQNSSPAAGGLITAAALGALAGASGLAWWLWRQSRRPSLATTAKASSDLPSAGGHALPDRVNQLNQAIEDVRRQLESLHSPS